MVTIKMNAFISDDAKLPFFQEYLYMGQNKTKNDQKDYTPNPFLQ